MVRGQAGLQGNSLAADTVSLQASAVASEEPPLQAVLLLLAGQAAILPGHLVVTDAAVGYAEPGRDHPGLLVLLKESPDAAEA